MGPWCPGGHLGNDITFFAARGLGGYFTHPCLETTTTQVNDVVASTITSSGRSSNIVAEGPFIGSLHVRLSPLGFCRRRGSCSWQGAVRWPCRQLHICSCAPCWHFHWPLWSRIELIVSLVPPHVTCGSIIDRLLLSPLPLPTTAAGPTAAGPTAAGPAAAARCCCPLLLPQPPVWSPGQTPAAVPTQRSLSPINTRPAGHVGVAGMLCTWAATAPEGT